MRWEVFPLVDALFPLLLWLLADRHDFLWLLPWMVLGLTGAIDYGFKLVAQMLAELLFRRRRRRSAEAAFDPVRIRPGKSERRQ